MDISARHLFSFASLSEIKINFDQLSPSQRITAANYLLTNLNANSFSNAQMESDFDWFFQQNDVDIFMTLINSIRKLGVQCFKRDKIINLTSTFIYQEDYLKKLFLSTCYLNPSVLEKQIIDTQLTSAILSLPDVVANLMKFESLSQFQVDTFFSRIIDVLYSCCQEIRDWIVQEKSCSLEFISQLVGRICFNSHSKLVWERLFDRIARNCLEDFIWRRIAFRLAIATQKDQHLESVVKPIICFSTTIECVGWFLSDSVKSNAKLKFLLTTKFLIIAHFENDATPKNIFGYLNSTSVSLFTESYQNVLTAWSNANAIKHRSYTQHFYLSRCLMVGAKFLKSFIEDSTKETFRKLLMRGIEIHLSHSQEEFRNIGMVVGQKLAEIFVSKNEKIDFEIKQTEDIKRLLNLFDDHVDKTEGLENDLQSGLKEDHLKKIKNEIISNYKEEVESDDFEPFDMSNDTSTSQNKKPIYVRDCMLGLGNRDSPEWTESCLESAEFLIRSNSKTISGIAEEFTKILFYLEDTGSDKFIGLRLRGLQALCCVEPKIVAHYLIELFYSKNLTVRQRIDVLEILACSSQELSGRDTSERFLPTNESELSKTLNQKLNLRAEELVDKNSVKTRIISSGFLKNTKPNEHINKFAPVAGFFFFPLMQKYDRHDISYNLFEEDSYVLGRLLYTLGIMMQAASHQPISRQMALALADFIWTFRYHCDSFVREALLFGVCSFLSSVSSVFLLDQMQFQLIELQQWLKDVIEKDPAAECIQRARVALLLTCDIANLKSLN